MLNQEKVETIKNEVFEYIVKHLEKPISNDFYPSKRKTGIDYNNLLKEKNTLLKDKSKIDEFGLINFFKDLDEILIISDDNKRIYSKINNNELSDEEIYKIIFDASIINEQILSKLSYIDELDSLQDKSKELKKMNAMKKLIDQRVKFLQNVLEKENKKTR